MIFRVSNRSTSLGNIKGVIAIFSCSSADKLNGTPVMAIFSEFTFHSPKPIPVHFCASRNKGSLASNKTRAEKKGSRSAVEEVGVGVGVGVRVDDVVAIAFDAGPGAQTT